jgi:hypothetical protein
MLIDPGFLWEVLKMDKRLNRKGRKGDAKAAKVLIIDDLLAFFAKTSANFAVKE